MGFNKLHRMSDTYSRIMLSLFSHNFITTNISFDLFQDMLARIEDTKKKNARIVFNDNIV